MSLEFKDPLENKEETDPNSRDLEPMIVEEGQNVATGGNENLPPVADDLSPSATDTEGVSSKPIDQDNCEPATESLPSKPLDKESNPAAETVSIKSLNEDPNRQTEEKAIESESEDIFDFVDPEGDSDSTIDNYDAYYEAAEQFYDSDSGEEIRALMNLQDNMGSSKSKSTKDSKANGKRDRRYQDSSSDEYEESWPKPWRSARERKTRKPYSFTRRWSQKDTEDYRQGYPGKKDYANHRLNLDFYTNKLPSRPSGDYIDNIHTHWFGDHRRLEDHHGYIQWLFPIRENGMNFHAQELQLHEAKSIMDNRMAHKRVLKSYKLMLDFYGMHLKDEKTGELERGDNWRERFAHLNRSMHNYLRITRILKSLGELGYEHLKAPFVRFVLEEALKKKTLERTVDSCYNYWIETIKDDKDREELHDYADELITGGSSS